MNTNDYGDVLPSPARSPPTSSRLLRAARRPDELGKKYRLLNEQAFEGKSTASPSPATPRASSTTRRSGRRPASPSPDHPGGVPRRLQAIKDNGDDSPLYTNYKDGWPLTQWDGKRGAVTGDPDALNKLAKDDAPWADGNELRIIDSLLYDAVKAGPTEADPTTTNWEDSKKLIGTGKIATMMLGSWAIAQMQAAARPPAPTRRRHRLPAVPGRRSTASSTRSSAATTRSASTSTPSTRRPPGPGSTGSPTSPATPSRRAACRRWSTAPVPGDPRGLQSTGGRVHRDEPGAGGRGGAAPTSTTRPRSASTDPKYRQQLVDAARGGARTKEQIFADLNKKWADGPRRRRR